MIRKSAGFTVFAILIVWVSCVLCIQPSSGAGAVQIQAITTDDGGERGDQAEVNIKAPTNVKVGDVIYIDLSESLGNGFDFEVEPVPPGLRTFSDGNMIVCGTGDKNVTYTFMISCALEGDSDIAIHKIKVTGAVEEVIIPVNPGENLIEKVKEWASYVDSPSKNETLMLATSFEASAGLIKDGTLTSRDSVIKVTAASNRNAVGDNIENWSPFLNSLSVELKAMAMDDQLLDVESHISVWLDISQGLKEYASTLD